DRYYTETESDVLLSGKSDVGHTHDDRYYTESESDAQLAGKADVDHNHDGIYSLVGHAHAEATPGAAGFMSASDKSKVNGIEANATADQTSTEIVTAFTSEVPVATQAEIEAGALTDPR